MNDDSRLIDQTLAGDTAAFGQLVERYQDRLFNTVLHLVSCQAEAEDVVQDAFVQAYVKLDSFRGTSAFYTWLYRIAFNVAASKRRRQRLEFSIEQAEQRSGAQPVDRSESADARLERQESAEQVRVALANLSQEHREIVVLREMEGCSYESIAEILGVAVGTVRSRLHRARMELREHLRRVLQEQQS